jgi:ParB family chromosome partitioning protein
MPTKKNTEPAYALKGVDLLFQPESETTGEMLPVSEIVPRANQPRRYFDPDALARLTQSVQENGVLQPVLVRSGVNGKYELIAGERRLRAAQAAGLNMIPAVVRDMNEEEATEIALLENLQREDLNPVEETEGILDLLTLKLRSDRQAIISMLNTESRTGQSAAEEITQHPDWEVLTKILSAVGLSPQSFRVHRLPLLKMPEDILEALRQGKIQYTKTREIAKISDEIVRKQLLDRAIAENWSLSVIRKEVNQLKKQKTSDLQKDADALKKRMDSALKRLKKVKALDNSARRKELETIMQTIEAFLEKVE